MLLSAISPNGSRLAVVDADASSLTLIDAATLAVDVVQEIHRPEGLAHRLVRWLGIVPQGAQAKAVDGPTVSAVFSVDGSALYVTGREPRAGETLGDVSGMGLGVQRIDVASGEITAEVLAGQEVTQVLPAPDGSAIYAIGSVTSWWDSQAGGSAYLLRHLDPETLKAAAEGVYPQWPQVVMLAMKSPASP